MFLNYFERTEHRSNSSYLQRIANFNKLNLLNLTFPLTQHIDHGNTLHEIIR